MYLQDKIRELEQALVEQETMQMRMDAIERECHETQARVCVHILVMHTSHANSGVYMCIYIYIYSYALVD